MTENSVCLSLNSSANASNLDLPTILSFGRVEKLLEKKKLLVTCQVQFRSFPLFYQAGHVKSCLYFQKVKEGCLNLFIEDFEFSLTINQFNNFINIFLCSY